MNKCVGLIYLSCLEGQAGSVVNCLHDGLIPIISYETGIDADNIFGVVLKDCFVDEITASLQMISTIPAKKLKQMSGKAWEFARANHTREKFAEEYLRVIEGIMNDRLK